MFKNKRNMGHILNVDSKSTIRDNNLLYKVRCFKVVMVF